MHAPSCKLSGLHCQEIVAMSLWTTICVPAVKLVQWMHISEYAQPTSHLTKMCCASDTTASESCRPGCDLPQEGECDTLLVLPLCLWYCGYLFCRPWPGPTSSVHQLSSICVWTHDPWVVELLGMQGNVRQGQLCLHSCSKIGMGSKGLCLCCLPCSDLCKHNPYRWGWGDTVYPKSWALGSLLSWSLMKYAESQTKEPSQIHLCRRVLKNESSMNVLNTAACLSCRSSWQFEGVLCLFWNIYAIVMQAQTWHARVCPKSASADLSGRQLCHLSVLCSCPLQVILQLAYLQCSLLTGNWMLVCWSKTPRQHCYLWQCIVTWLL